MTVRDFLRAGAARVLAVGSPLVSARVSVFLSFAGQSFDRFGLMEDSFPVSSMHSWKCDLVRSMVFGALGNNFVWCWHQSFDCAELPCGILLCGWFAGPRGFLTLSALRSSERLKVTALCRLRKAAGYRSLEC